MIRGLPIHYSLEASAIRRMNEGVKTEVLYKESKSTFKAALFETRYPGALLMFLLKGPRPEVYNRSV